MQLGGTMGVSGPQPPTSVLRNLINTTREPTSRNLTVFDVRRHLKVSGKLRMCGRLPHERLHRLWPSVPDKRPRNVSQLMAS